MSKATTPVGITGKITANPNPIPLTAGSCTKITWETNDPLGAEVRVSTSNEGNKLLTRGQNGFVEVPWIEQSKTYYFELYGCSDPPRCLDRVTVRRTDGSLKIVLDQVIAKASAGNIDLYELAQFVAKVVPRCLNNTRYAEFFRIWEQHGLHITPVHFYQPIPDTRKLPLSLWDRPSELLGLEMNDADQLDLLQNVFPRFRDEYNQIPLSGSGHGDRFHLNNGRFDGTDALVAYCMVRHCRPSLIVEVGSGYSSLISAQALVENTSGSLVCVEPHPPDYLEMRIPGLTSLVRTNVQEVELSFFSRLRAGDILFIDSSHTVKIGGDVNYLFLEVLPRLNPGVIVHVHDISFPCDYRREWVMEEFRFWAEQYLLQAFLAFNSEFEVVICNSYLGFYFPEELKTCFPRSPWWGGGSFWMRRREIGSNGLPTRPKAQTLSHR